MNPENDLPLYDPDEQATYTLEMVADVRVSRLALTRVQALKGVSAHDGVQVVAVMGAVPLQQAPVFQFVQRRVEARLYSFRFGFISS